MQKKKGISLLVLTITIIVIIILSSAVILSIVDTNVIGNANKAVFFDKVTKYRDSLSMYHANAMLKEPYDYIGESLQADSSSVTINGKKDETKNILDIISNMENEDKDKYEIQNGELVYKGDDETEMGWAGELIPVKTVEIAITTVPSITEIEISSEATGEYVDKHAVEGWKIVVNKLSDNNASEKVYEKEIVTSDTNITHLVKNLEQNTNYEITVSVKINGKIFTKTLKQTVKTTIDSIVPNKPQVIISKDGNEFNVVTTFSDDKFGSGINMKSCKYVLNNENTEYEVIDGLWNNATSFEEGLNNTANVKFTNLSNEIYYFHVLSVDNVGNKLSSVYELDAKAPNISSLTASISTSEYAKKATVTISGSTADMKAVEYTLPGEEVFKTYSAPFEVTKNGAVKVRAKDALGNISEAKTVITVSKIDNLAPKETITLTPNSISDAKKVSVAITATDSEANKDNASSGIAEVKYLWKDDNKLLDINNASWNSASTVTNGNSVNSELNLNKTIYLHVRAKDNAGNIRTYVSGAYKLDNTAPSTDGIAVKLSPNGFTNSNVEVALNNIPSDAKVKKYKSPDEDWKDYTAPFTVTKNGTINVKVIDAAGNEDTKNFEISKIDKLVPDSVTMTPNTDSNKKSVSVTVNASDAEGKNGSCKSDINEIKYLIKENDTSLEVGSSEWTTAKTVVNGDSVVIDGVTGDRYLHLLVTDKAGNAVTKVSGKYTLDNTAPSVEGITATLNTSSFTNGDVVVTIDNLPTDAVTKQYISPDQTSFKDCDNGSKITVTKNGDITIKVIDVAKNESTKVFKVENIDKLAPSAKLSKNSSTSTKSASVKITATDANGKDGYCKSEIASVKYQWRNSNAKVTADDKGWTAITNNTNATISGVDGDRYLHVLATDNAGNNTIYVSDKFVLDNTAPSKDAISISLSTGNSFTNANPEVTIVYPNETGLKKEYSIDGKVFNTYTTSFTISSNCTITAKATDAAGNETVKTYEVTTIDTTVPSITNFTYTVSKTEINVTSVTCSDNNKVTNYQYITTGKDSTKITNSSYKFTGLTVNTSYTVTVKVFDAAGNSNSISKTIKTLPSTPSKPNLIDNDDTGVSNTDNITNKTKVGIDGTSDKSMAIKVKNITLDNAITNVTSNTIGKFTASIDLKPNVVNKIQVIATNESGNTESEVLDITCDTVSPTKPVLNNTSSGNWSKSDVTISTSTTETGSGLDTITYSYDKLAENNFATINKVDKTASNTWSDNISTPVYARAKDIAGNISDWSDVSNIKIDKQGPSKPSVTNDSNGNWTNKDVNISASVSDSGCGVDTIVYSYDKVTENTDLTVNASLGTGSKKWTSDIEKTVYFRAKDKLGNVSEWSDVTYLKIDKIPPTISNSNISLSTGSNYTNGNPTVTINYPSDATFKQYNIGNGWVTYNNAFTISSNCIIYAKAIDRAGNESSTSGYKVTTIDKTVPSISNFSYSVTQNSITISNITCSDESGIQYYKYTTSGKDSGKITNSSYTLSNLSSNTYYNVTVTVYDKAGNSNSYTKNSIRTLATYTVSYNANGGSGAPGSQTKIEGKTLTLSSTVPTKSNYEFLGWSTSSSATSATYKAGGSYTSNSGATLYAVWKAKPVPIVSKVKSGEYISIPGVKDNFAVLYNDSRGVEIISVSTVGNVTLGSKNNKEKARSDYANLINILNNAARNYMKNNMISYAKSARCVGSNPNNPDLYGSINEKNLVYLSNYQVSKLSSEIKQTHHEKDVQQMRNNNLLTTANNYWLASRDVYTWADDTRFKPRRIINGNYANDPHNYEYIFCEWSELFWQYNEYTFNLRPCILLKNEVKVTEGNGTLENPYKIII